MIFVGTVRPAASHTLPHALATSSYDATVPFTWLVPFSKGQWQASDGGDGSGLRGFGSGAGRQYAHGCQW